MHAGIARWPKITLPRSRRASRALGKGTIDRVAKDLGEDVDFLFDAAIEMEPEDGLIWVLSLGDESVMAFTDDGVDSLVELIKIHRETKPLISAPSASPAAYAGRPRQLGTEMNLYSCAARFFGASPLRRSRLRHSAETTGTTFVSCRSSTVSTPSEAASSRS